MFVCLNRLPHQTLDATSARELCFVIPLSLPHRHSISLTPHLSVRPSSICYSSSLSSVPGHHSVSNFTPVKLLFLLILNQPRNAEAPLLLLSLLLLLLPTPEGPAIAVLIPVTVVRKT